MKRGIRIMALVLVLLLSDVSAASGESLPNEAFITGFVGHAQSYAIDCEIRSAVDWASFWGVSIGETEFLQALPRTDNPDRGFVGDPNDIWGRIPPHGYGVHADPIAKTLREYGLQAHAVHDYTWDDLRWEIDAGRPVIVWIIGAMWQGTPVDYAASDGSASRVAAYEHTMTLVGYTSTTVQVVDSASGHLDTYWLDDFLTSWTVLGNMAVIGSLEPSITEELSPRGRRENSVYSARLDENQDTNQNTTQGTAQGTNRSAAQNAIQEAVPGLDQDTIVATYTVQRGDYVMKLARRFGVSWLELARLNDLYAPYIIYPGQELQLPEAVQTESAPATEAPPVTLAAGSTLGSLPFDGHREALARRRSAHAMLVELGASDPRTVSQRDIRLVLGNGMVLEVHLLARLNSLRPSHILFPGWSLGLH